MGMILSLAARHELRELHRSKLARHTPSMALTVFHPVGEVLLSGSRTIPGCGLRGFSMLIVMSCKHQRAGLVLTDRQ